MVEVWKRIYHNGIDSVHTNWHYYGETRKQNLKVHLSEEVGNMDPCEEDNVDDIENEIFYDGNEMANYQNTMDNAIKSFYPWCNKFTKLFSLNLLYKVKGKYDHFIKLWHEVFPEDNVFPSSMYKVKKILVELGMKYEKNTYLSKLLYFFIEKEYKNIDVYSQCQESRWKVNPI